MISQWPPPHPKTRYTCIYLRSGQVIRMKDLELTVTKFTGGGGISALKWTNNDDSRILYVNVEEVVAVTVES